MSRVVSSSSVWFLGSLFGFCVLSRAIQFSWLPRNRAPLCVPRRRSSCIAAADAYLRVTPSSAFCVGAIIELLDEFCSAAPRQLRIFESLVGDPRRALFVI